MNRDKEEMIRNQIAKAEEKLQAAAFLLDQKFADDAISRAYYAMFHAASAVLLFAVAAEKPELQPEPFMS